MDLDAYFRRIGLDGDRTPTLATLAGVQAAHALSIPFENLDIHLGRPIHIDVERVWAKLVDARRGGYCFEQNTLLDAVLRGLGFSVTPFAARVLIGGREASARTHKVLAVEADGDRWLVDVGFGGAGPLGPIAMRADNATTFGKWTYRLVRDGPQWVLELEQADGWMELYGFTEEPQLPVDYELPNWWTSTHPASPFVQAITVQWPGFDRQLVLRGRELTEFRPDGQTVRLIEGDDELLDVLAAQFGLVFPTGTRFRSPLDAADDAADRSSRTAAKSSNADPH